MEKSILPVMGALLLGACVTYTVVPHQPAKPTDPQEMLGLINRVRSQARICGNKRMAAARPLKWSLVLERSAQAHADDMARNNYYRHNSRDGRTPENRVKQAGYTGWGGFENIAGGYESAEKVIAGWIRSPGHCENLMNPEITEVGMAVASRAGTEHTNYWVQNFGMDLETFRREKPNYIIP